MKDYEGPRFLLQVKVAHYAGVVDASAAIVGLISKINYVDRLDKASWHRAQRVLPHQNAKHHLRDHRYPKSQRRRFGPSICLCR